MARKWVTLNGAGASDGSSVDNAESLSQINSLIATMSAGDDLAIVQGQYPAQVVNVTKPIDIHGVTAGGADAPATFYGLRTKKWPANGVWTDGGAYTAATEGSDVFQLKPGSEAPSTHQMKLRFFNARDIGIFCRPNYSNALTKSAVTVEDIYLFNTDGLVYPEAANDGQVHITGNRCRAVAYSMGMFRAFGNMFLTDCHGDARNQFHSPTTNLFGAHVQDMSAADPSWTVPYQSSFQTCSFGNHNAPAPAGSSKDPAVTGVYGQGDGIVVEDFQTILFMYDIVVWNNYDRGFDSKSGSTPGTIKRITSWGNGFDVAMHSDTVDLYIEDSYFGPTKRNASDTGKSAPIQASGNLHVTRCVMDQTGVATGGQFLGIGYGSVQPAHTQAGTSIPQRCGHFFVTDSIYKMPAGMSKYLLSPGGSPNVTPTQTESNVRAA